VIVLWSLARRAAQELGVEVKIVEFGPLNKGKAEEKLADLLNQGWRIVTGGGNNSWPGFVVILQRDTPRSSRSIEQYERQV
jgi:hypothetical protein